MFSLRSLGPQDKAEPRVVGGADPNAFLSMDQKDELKLGKDGLAQVHCCTIMKHIDTNTFLESE